MTAVSRTEIENGNGWAIEMQMQMRIWMMNFAASSKSHFHSVCLNVNVYVIASASGSVRRSEIVKNGSALLVSLSLSEVDWKSLVVRLQNRSLILVIDLCVMVV